MMRRWMYGSYELLRITFGVMTVGGNDSPKVAGMRWCPICFGFILSCVPGAQLHVEEEPAGICGSGLSRID